MANEVMNTTPNGNAVANVMPTNSDFMLGLAELKRRADMVTQIKQQIMRPEVHFGTIPGCGKKPTLLKNGAELLCMAFKLASDAKVEIADLGNGHREYTVTTTLSSIGTGELIATGLGSCSTMESKYRYRGSEMENTGRPVPKEYWNGKDPATLGGKGFTAKKDESGKWMIFKKGEGKLENPDIADVYNTVLKMASKRSLVDAVLKATGGSCEFTQDIEDNPQGFGASAGYGDYYEAEVVDEPARPQPSAQQSAAPMHHGRGSGFAQEVMAMQAMDANAYAKLKEKMKKQGWTKPSDVPENRREEVKSWFNEFMNGEV